MAIGDLSDSRVLLSFIFTVTFLILALIVLRKSRSQTNLLFSLGSALFGLGTLFGGLGYLILDYQISFWSFGTSILILSPIFYYSSARQIITGTRLQNDVSSVLVIVGFIGLALIIFIIYPLIGDVDLNIIIGDTILILALSLSVTQFFAIFRLSPSDLKLKLLVLILGFTLAIVSLTINIILSFSGSGDSLFRYVFPLIGNFFVVLSFITVPTQENVK